MPIQQVFDREKVRLNIARLKKGGENFEVVLENINKALALKSGESIDVREIINGDLIFKNAHQAQKAAEHKIKEVFGTEDHFEVAKIIIQKGEIQLTSAQRRKIIEQKKRKILEYIHQNACDPKTKLPIPLQRIELAMQEARIRIDPADSVAFQVERILPKLRAILPMSFEHIKFRITIPAQYSGTAYSAIKSKFTLKDEKWRTDGSVQIELEIVAGKRNILFSLLNKLTNGEVNIEEIKGS